MATLKFSYEITVDGKVVSEKTESLEVPPQLVHRIEREFELMKRRFNLG